MQTLSPLKCTRGYKAQQPRENTGSRNRHRVQGTLARFVLFSPPRTAVAKPTLAPNKHSCCLLPPLFPDPGLRLQEPNGMSRGSLLLWFTCSSISPVLSFSSAGAPRQANARGTNLPCPTCTDSFPPGLNPTLRRKSTRPAVYQHSKGWIKADGGD